MAEKKVGAKVGRKKNDTKATPEPVVPAEMTADDKVEAEKIGQMIVQQPSGTEVFSKMRKPQLELIKRTVAKGATDDELKMFLQVCAGAQLNPFLRQVHFVKRWDNKRGEEVGAIQVGIDGFRAIAESGGQYAGSDDAVFRNDFDLANDKETIKVPGEATVTVWKLMEGNRYAFTATARWLEYYPGPKQGYMWRKMPYGQLAKCAEALALRKAFPKLLSGLYAPEEMEQAGGAQAREDKPFDKAMVMIPKQVSIQELEKLRERIKGSDKYTEEEKSKVFKAINDRITELMPKHHEAEVIS